MNGFTLTNPNGGYHTFHITELTAAERLLALYEDGPVVEVIIIEPDYKGYLIKYSDGYSHHVPVDKPENCLSPGRYKLMRWENND